MQPRLVVVAIQNGGEVKFQRLAARVFNIRAVHKRVAVLGQRVHAAQGVASGFKRYALVTGIKQGILPTHLLIPPVVALGSLRYGGGDIAA